MENYATFTDTAEKITVAGHVFHHPTEAVEFARNGQIRPKKLRHSLRNLVCEQYSYPACKVIL